MCVPTSCRGVGPEAIRGRDTVVDAMTRFFGDSQPTYEVIAGPIEQGDYVFTVARATIAGGEQRELALGLWVSRLG